MYVRMDGSVLAKRCVQTRREKENESDRKKERERKRALPKLPFSCVKHTTLSERNVRVECYYLGLYVTYNEFWSFVIKWHADSLLLKYKQTTLCEKCFLSVTLFYHLS